MLKNEAEIKMFIRLLFGSSEIEINGVTASNDDLVRLCKAVSSGTENIVGQKQYISARKIKKICITTF